MVFLEDAQLNLLLERYRSCYCGSRWRLVDWCPILTSSGPAHHAYPVSPHMCRVVRVLGILIQPDRRTLLYAPSLQSQPSVFRGSRVHSTHNNDSTPPKHSHLLHNFVLLIALSSHARESCAVQLLRGTCRGLAWKSPACWAWSS